MEKVERIDRELRRINQLNVLENIQPADLLIVEHEGKPCKNTVKSVGKKMLTFGDLGLSVDEKTAQITVQLKDIDGNIISEKTADLPSGGGGGGITTIEVTEDSTLDLESEITKIVVKESVTVDILDSTNGFIADIVTFAPCEINGVSYSENSIFQMLYNNGWNVANVYGAVWN